MKKKLYKDFQLMGSPGKLDEGTAETMRPILFVSDLAFSPPTDVWETEDEIIVIMEIANVKAEDFKIQYISGFLKIEGERKEPGGRDQVKIMKIHKKDIDYGPFLVKIKMNTRIAKEKISAVYKNGILKVVLKKKFSEEAESEIDVSVAQE